MEDWIITARIEVDESCPFLKKLCQNVTLRRSRRICFFVTRRKSRCPAEFILCSRRRTQHGTRVIGSIAKLKAKGEARCH
jgi:hypothetical protein